MDDRNDTKKRLQDKLANKRKQRRGSRRNELIDTKEAANKYDVQKPDQKKMKKNVKSQKIDDILKDLGITDPKVKEEMIVAMQNGRIKNVDDLSSWLALHAPLSQVRPQDVLAVQEATRDAEEMANRMTERIESPSTINYNDSTKGKRQIKNPRDIEEQALEQHERQNRGTKNTKNTKGKRHIKNPLDVEHQMLEQHDRNHKQTLDQKIVRGSGKSSVG